MTKAFIERVKKELTVYTKKYIYYGGYCCDEFLITRRILDRTVPLTSETWKIVYREKNTER